MPRPGHSPETEKRCCATKARQSQEKRKWECGMRGENKRREKKERVESNFPHPDIRRFSDMALSSEAGNSTLSACGPVAESGPGSLRCWSFLFVATQTGPAVRSAKPAGGGRCAHRATASKRVRAGATGDAAREERMGRWAACHAGGDQIGPVRRRPIPFWPHSGLDQSRGARGPNRRFAQQTSKGGFGLVHVFVGAAAG
ncbi:uncharacterized protein VTP21DRAFT_1976 [Calcarisporiella thermophila]|uniref:uncharacterized protein n=1 Tax=Calcarisporiella thermophila TaxID=911321 RepID=UPI00374333DF